MKYIDVEKLKAEIKRLEEMDYPCDTSEQSTGFYDALDSIKSFIDSLQQEQPIQVNTLTWRDINDLERIINNVHYEFRNGIGEKSFGEEVLERFREERDEQEQPGVDLEKEIEEYINNFFYTEPSTADFPPEDIAYTMWKEDIRIFARHFYELGLKARKV